MRLDAFSPDEESHREGAGDIESHMGKVKREECSENSGVLTVNNVFGSVHPGREQCQSGQSERLRYQQRRHPAFLFLVLQVGDFAHEQEAEKHDESGDGEVEASQRRQKNGVSAWRLNSYNVPSQPTSDKPNKAKVRLSGARGVFAPDEERQSQQRRDADEIQQRNQAQVGVQAEAEKGHRWLFMMVLTSECAS